MFQTTISSSALFFSLSQSVFGCLCSEFTYDEVFARADHVFVGQVIKKSRVGALLRGKHSTSRIEVRRKFKGTPFEKVSAYVPFMHSDCDLNLHKGKEYLVFAAGEPPFRLRFCSGTKEIDRIPNDWKQKLEEP